MKEGVPVFGDKDWIEKSRNYTLMPWGKVRGKARQGKSFAEIRGAGPEGKTCKDCFWLRARKMTKTYYKCGAMKLTHGPGTDTRLKDPACRLFKATAATEERK